MKGYNVGDKVKVKYLPPEYAGVWGNELRIGDEITIWGVGNSCLYNDLKARYGIKSDYMLYFERGEYYIFIDWVEKAPPSQRGIEKQCSCDIVELMRYGCKCGSL